MAAAGPGKNPPVRPKRFLLSRLPRMKRSPFPKITKRFGGFENIDLGPLPPVSRSASGAKAASLLKVKRFV